MASSINTDISADINELVRLVSLGLIPNFKSLIESYVWRHQNALETLYARQKLATTWETAPLESAQTVLRWGFPTSSANLGDWKQLFACTTNIDDAITHHCHGASISSVKNWHIASWSKLLASHYPDRFFILDSRVCNAINYYLIQSNQPQIRRCFPVLPRRSDPKKINPKILRAEKQKEILLNDRHAKICIDCHCLYIDIYCNMMLKISSNIEQNHTNTRFKFHPTETDVSLSELRRLFTFNPIPHLVEMALFQKGDLSHD